MTTLSTDLYTRSSPFTTSGDQPAWHKYVGLTLALSSALFIGSSFVIKKRGLLDSNQEYGTRAGHGYAYLKSGMWWGGLFLMLIGELCNLAAYAFSPAVLVTPLGALSVVISAILSALLLKEKLNFSGQIGCAQCIIGAIILVLNAPATQSTTTIKEFYDYAWTPTFIAWASVNLVTELVLVFWAGPKWGDKYPIVPIAICSLAGAFVVAATQGVGASIVHTFSNPSENQFQDWRMYPLIAFILITGAIQISYLNKALNIYSTAVVTPIYYVCFTSATLLCSAILLRQFAVEDAVKAATAVLGFVVIVGGVSLLFAFSMKESRRLEGGVQLLPNEGEYSRFDRDERDEREFAGRDRGESSPYGKIGGGRERVYV